MRFRSEIWKLKTAAENTFGPHCSTSLFTLKFHSLNHLVDDLERFGGFSLLDAGPFGHFSFLVKKS